MTTVVPREREMVRNSVRSARAAVASSPLVGSSSSNVEGDHTGRRCSNVEGDRAFVAIELVDGYGIDTSTFDSLTPKEWRTPGWRSDVGILGAFAGATTALSLVFTMALHKDKQR